MSAEIVKLKYRERPIFKPDHFKWIIITIKNYDKLRSIPCFSRYNDLPPVDFDARVVREGIKRLGALDEDIIQITDDDCHYDRLG